MSCLMSPSRRSLALVGVAVALATGAVSTPAAAPAPTAERVTRYDLATRDDLLLDHLVAPLLEGDVADWLLLRSLLDQLGPWIDPFLDARSIAGIITAAMPREGQPLSRLDALVAGCAQALDIGKPAVYVRLAPVPTLYVVEAYGRHHLVLTSEL